MARQDAGRLDPDPIQVGERLRALSRSARATSRPLSRGVGLLVNHLVEDGRVTFVDDPGSGMGRAGGLHAGRPGRRHHPWLARCAPLGRPLLRDLVRGAPEPRRDLLTWAPVVPPPPSGPPSQTISLRAFSGIARTTLRAGLAWIVIGWPVNGFFPGPASGGGLAHHLELQEAGDDELTGALLAQLLGYQSAQGGEDGGDLLLAQPGRLGQCGVDHGPVGRLGSGGGRCVGGLGCGLRGRSGGGLAVAAIAN